MHCSSALQAYCQQFEYSSEKSAGYWLLSCLFKFVQIFRLNICELMLKCQLHNSQSIWTCFFSRADRLIIRSGSFFSRHRRHVHSCVSDLSCLLADTSSDMPHSNRWSDCSEKKVWYLCIQFDHLICDSETLANHWIQHQYSEERCSVLDWPSWQQFLQL
jgi:hypothetical protein